MPIQGILAPLHQVYIGILSTLLSRAIKMACISEWLSPARAGCVTAMDIGSTQQTAQRYVVAVTASPIGAHEYQQHLPVRNRRRILLRLQTLDMY